MSLLTTERIKHDRALRRLRHIKQSISEMQALLGGIDVAAIRSDSFRRAAFERFLEIISEASRHVPDAWKAEHADIPWRNIRDIGNHLRHVYDDLDLTVLWDIYQNDLGPLEAAIDAMLAEHAPKDWSP